MINVACASDANFYPFTATMLASVFEHTTEPVAVYLLCHGLPEGVVPTLQRFVESRGHRFHAVPLNTASLNSLPVDSHASVANYYRLLLPDVLPAAVERVLYLDSDLIVRRSLHDLWEEKTSAAGIAAVRDFNYDRLNERRLEFPDGRTYFNSGVLLIDLAVWRRQRIGPAVIDRIARDPQKMQLWDQDGLNLVFADTWRELPLTWNVQHGIFIDPRLGMRFAELTEHPAIVHFTGTQKPWLRGGTHPYRAEFERCYALNPFNDSFPLPPPTLRDHARSAKRRALALYRETLLPKVARQEAWWQSSPGRIVNRVVEERQQRVAERAALDQEAAKRTIVGKLIPDLTVQRGPFRGLKYDEISALGSMWSPKLLGSYEAELHPVVETLLRRRWDTVLDIGCAEGYYAVGFALGQSAPVVAYDIDPQARTACRRLAEVNGVADRIETKSVFALAELEKFPAHDELLIFCDCEGAERHIFHANVPGFARLATCHLVIELHDFIELGVSGYLRDLFAPTHEVEFIRSVDDLVKPRVAPCGLIESLSYEQQVSLQAEHRPRAMEWAVFRPKDTIRDPAPAAES